jgi:phosphoribosylanthranilate isomerase
MLRTRIKICGITDPQSAELAGRVGADAIGLVFVEQSVRCVSVERARRIIGALPAWVEPVGLFADQPPETVRSVAQSLNLRTVQLHGSESPADAEALDPLRVVKALHFDADHAEDLLALWCPPRPNVAGLLWDTPPDEGAAPGGSGRTFHWEALASLLHETDHADRPATILAGGLEAGNVDEAIHTIAPYGVDVSSGVERARGQKDAEHIATFCAAVWQADRPDHR